MSRQPLLRTADGKPALVHCPVTPYRADGEIDERALARLLAFHAAQQPMAVALMTSWGDSIGLSNPAERDTIIDVASQVLTGVPFVVNVTSSGTAHAVHLAEQAATHGAAAILVGAPLYWRVRDDELTEHLATVASSVPQIDAYLLNDPPAPSASDISPSVVSTLADRCGNIVGLVDTRLEYQYLVSILDAGNTVKPFQVLGQGDYVLPLARLGVDGVLSGVAGIIPQALADLCEAVASDDDLAARALQHHCTRVARMIAGSPKALKAIHARLGRDVGGPRAPSRHLGGGELERLLGALKTALNQGEPQGWND